MYNCNGKRMSMKTLYALLLSFPAILTMSACQGTEPVMNPWRSQDEVTKEPASRLVHTPQLGDGDNYVLFSYEHAGHPSDVDPGEDAGSMVRPVWIKLEEEEGYSEFAKVMRFDDDQTLKQHYCREYAEIDWTKKTLILAYGMRLYEDCPIIAVFDRKSEGKYSLTLEFVPSLASSLVWWRVAVLVDKLDADAEIVLETPYYKHES